MFIVFLGQVRRALIVCLVLNLGYGSFSKWGWGGPLQPRSCFGNVLRYSYSAGAGCTVPGWTPTVPKSQILVDAVLLWSHFLIKYCIVLFGRMMHNEPMVVYIFFIGSWNPVIVISVACSGVSMNY